ncbi:aspartate aminotransferase family protein [Flavobacterium columnare]|uniref:aspartate aminotransferase family protein n=1 Tax=Flavobacterium columnare TaxID=996 RepID=UPI001BC883AD|nr:aspartate aminotransferase family protein [Flavobacterium columnare]AUX17478.1 aminotransferase class III [Flavobacterium columnare]
MLKDFYKYQAQTSPHPLGMEVSHAIGSYIYDTKGKIYLDFVAGVSACTLGHQHPRVKQAIIDQMDKYAHVMVYGEYAQDPAIQFCTLLAQNMATQLNKTYLVNSGTEATEGALKLARRVTGRSQLISCYNAYHGNTMGSMSVMGFEERKQAFRPLIPDVDFITFNNEEDLQKITTRTAAIIIEPVAGNMGCVPPKEGFLQALREVCDVHGTLLIFDEVMTGFRLAKGGAQELFNIKADIVCFGKVIGGGLPVGAFAANEKHMDLLSQNPKLGHITTFGGHPVIAAASLATLKELIETDLMFQCLEKEQLFRKLLIHPLIKEVRGQGLMLAIMTDSPEITNQVIFKCQEKGLILFWLLFEGNAIRITPPLTLSNEEKKEGCGIIIDAMNEIEAD